jgi:Lrp/AsnC family transcriptional regulator, regulator for asnA, asnC and gidA
MVPLRDPANEGPRPDSVDAMHQPTRVLGARSSEEVSPLDHAIIESLQGDGRRPFTQIAAELGVSEAAVRARTNRLIDRGVLQIVGVADPLKLGYDQMAMIGVRCEADRMLEAAEAIAEFEEVIYVVATAGAWDLMVEVVCLDNEGLLRFLTEKLRRIPGVVSTESYVYLRIVKQSFHWSR